MKAGLTVRRPRAMVPTQVMDDTVAPRRPAALAVVLACARAPRDAETTHRVRRLVGQGPVDWPLVRRLALSPGGRNAARIADRRGWTLLLGDGRPAAPGVSAHLSDESASVGLVRTRWPTHRRRLRHGPSSRLEGPGRAAPRRFGQHRSLIGVPAPIQDMPVAAADLGQRIVIQMSHQPLRSGPPGHPSLGFRSPVSTDQQFAGS